MAAETRLFASDLTLFENLVWKLMNLQIKQGQCSVPHFVHVAWLIYRFQRAADNSLKCDLQSQGIFESKFNSFWDPAESCWANTSIDQMQEWLPKVSVPDSFHLNDSPRLMFISHASKWFGEEKGILLYRARSTPNTGWAWDYNKENKTTPTWPCLLSFFVRKLSRSLLWALLLKIMSWFTWIVSSLKLERVKFVSD